MLNRKCSHHLHLHKKAEIKKLMSEEVAFAESIAYLQDERTGRHSRPENFGNVKQLFLCFRTHLTAIHFKGYTVQNYEIDPRILNKMYRRNVERLLESP